MTTNLLGDVCHCWYSDILDNSKPFTIDPGDTTEHLVIFMGLEPFQNYQASLSVVTKDLVDQVTLGRPLQRNIPTNELLSVITGLQKEVSNLTSLQKKVKYLENRVVDLEKEVEVLENEVSYLNQSIIADSGKVTGL